ncbi:N4-gp56 family major capsid protein [Oricola sp.]|uniref:N4-gp56 family major capsid protein n=1 Tax=Oricola sp. TaxID=1979950 RepID=UPI003BACC1FD
MPATNIPFGDPKAQKKWSTSLFLDITRQSYFDKRFVGADENKVIQRLTDLESEAGDTISFDLSLQLRGRPTIGDNRLEGSEEQLRFATDTISIDQMRHAVSAGGKMTRKRTVHNMRTIARTKLSEYWSRYLDELFFIYMSGARGINEDYFEPTTYAGHAGNAIQAPDSDHLMYGGDATAKSDLDATDKMTKTVIEKAEVKARMMRATNPNAARMVPIDIDGAKHFVCLMSTFAEHDLRTADTTGWIDIQKAAAAAEGRKNPIFRGGLGMIKNCVLHCHESVIRFNDYGAGSDVAASRALFMGRQAGAVAYGTTGRGRRLSWEEDPDRDYGNEPSVAAGLIIGIKKPRFENRDFGVIALDTAAADPNA